MIGRGRPACSSSASSSRATSCSPLLVGKSVGLHPVWLMFALFAFGALFGFVGLLIAVPAAAAVAVLVRFAINRYWRSPLYTAVPSSSTMRVAWSKALRAARSAPRAKPR